MTSLADLVASRLCHDLVNPLGAIGNGVELLEMTGKADGPEVDLIRDAVRAAEARIRLFRLAFGGASHGQVTSLREAKTVVEGYFHQSRVAVVWMATADRSRQETKMALLMLLCAETALPMGGTVRIGPDPTGHWQLEATGPRLNMTEPEWDMLRTGTPPPDELLQPSKVQFAVLFQTAQSLGLTLNFIFEDETFQMSTA